MARRVAIIAIAQTKYEPRKISSSDTEIFWEVVKQVREETGLTYADRVQNGIAIDKIVTCCDDYWMRRQIGSDIYQQEIGAFQTDEERVCADNSALAVLRGALSVSSGKSEVTLVVSGSLESEVGEKGVIENIGFEPIYLQPLGIDNTSAAALQANRYMHKYGISQEQCAKVVVRDRKNAKNNPYTQELTDLTVDDVLTSAPVAYPIKVLDCKPVSDGACALILASEEAARKLTNNPVWITGMAQCFDTHHPGDRDLANCDALTTAAKRAYDMGGITDPRREINVAEIGTEYSYQGLLWLEGLGLCGQGEAGRLIDTGFTEVEGKLPINPSGGMLAGNPSFVAGLTRVAEAVLQLRGEAGARQLNSPNVALAHGTGGPCGQSQCVIILSK